MPIQTTLATVKYWLVDHPTVSNFEWKNGITKGASPQFLVISIISYLTLIFLLNKSFIFPPLSPPILRFISAVHNLVLLLLSLTMAVGCTLATLSQMPEPRWILCFPANKTPPRGPAFFWAYVFYLSKFLEFVDTFLIILGRSIQRLSFLHVYHHSTVVILCYLWLETSQSLFPVGLVLNSTVHVVMYGYYLTCTLGIRPSWKRLVTNCQIIQFVFGFLVGGALVYHHFFMAPCSGFSTGIFNLTFNASLLYLFIDFHSKNYSKRMQLMNGSHQGDPKDKEL